MLICQKNIEIDELEVGAYLAEASAVVKCYYTPGEPMVRYYPDGSGYPGCPSTLDAEILDYSITHVYDDVGDEVQVQLPKEDVLAAISKRLNDERLYSEFESDIESYLHPEEYWGRDDD